MATPIPDNRATFTLSEIVEACGGVLSPGAVPEQRVTTVQTDSRRVGPDGLFVALRGDSFDGHAFLEQVHAAGAGAAVVAENGSVPPGLPVVRVADTLRALGDLSAFHRRRWGGLVVGITGSAGKTTTKELTYAALCVVSDTGQAAVARTEGNLNNLVGVPMTLFTLQSKHHMAVVEMGTSKPGEIARLAEISAPQIGVVTSVAAAHAEGLGSVQGVAHEKAALLRALPESGTAIYCGDSAPLFAEIGAVRCRKLSFGTGSKADFCLLRQTITAGLEGSFASLCTYRVPEAQQSLEAPLAILGHGPAVDAAAALAVVYALQGPSAVQAAVAGLGRVTPVPGRMSPVQGPRGSLVVDDSYNANPASVLSSLRSLASLSAMRGGRAIAVLGDMKELGELSVEEHAAVGRACAALKIQTLITLGDDMAHALREAHAAGVPLTLPTASTSDAIAAVLDSLAPQDVVLVKGSRSMRMEQVVEGLVREAARA